MPLPPKYTVVFVDQVAGTSFTLTRTPAATFIDGAAFDGQTAQGILADIVVDQMLEQMEATA